MKKGIIRKALGFCTVLTAALFINAGNCNAQTTDEIADVVKTSLKEGKTTFEVEMDVDVLGGESKDDAVANAIQAIKNASLEEGKLCLSYSAATHYLPGSDVVGITYMGEFQDVVVLESEKDAYVKVYNALNNCDYDTVFYSEDNMYTDVLHLVLAQHPELNYGIEQILYVESNGTCWFEASKLASVDEIKVYKAMADAEAERIAKKLFKPGMTTKKKVTKLHKYLIKNCKYDTPAADSGKFTISHTVYGAFFNGKAVCAGYTGAFNLILSKANVGAMAVSGIGYNQRGNEYHAWNAYYLGGKMVYTDVTWDDPVPDQGRNGKIYKTYFNVSEKKIEADHDWEKVDYSEKYLNYTKYVLGL